MTEVPLYRTSSEVLRSESLWLPGDVPANGPIPNTHTAKKSTDVVALGKFKLWQRE